MENEFKNSDEKVEKPFYNETYFRNLFELSRDGIFIYDLDGRLQDVNAQFCDMLGYQAAQMLGRYVSDFRPESLDEHIEKVYEELVTSGSVQFESQFIKKDGGIIDVDVSASIFDAERGLGQAIVRDISDRKLLEETQRKAKEELEHSVKARTMALQESERRFRTLIEQASDALFVHDMEGNFLTVNHQACESLGYSREELMGLTVVDVDMNFDPEMLDALWLSLSAEESKIIESMHRRKDGTMFMVEVRVGRLMLDGEWAVLGIARDVTERKRLEAQLMQSQKMEAVGKLAGGVAHDFNNLLTVINGYAEQLLDHLDNDSLAYGQTSEVLRAGQRAATLTDQLLAFSRRQTLRPMVLDLNLLVPDMLKMLRRLIGEDIDLVAILGAGNGFVKADPNQLEHAIMNLAVNARDAMPLGGHLEIRTANVDVDVAFAQQHEGLSAGKYVSISVKDTGKGIDDDVLLHIFEPFFTTKEQGEGTGLGLSMVYGIVTQSGGTVTVDSVLACGTCFHIYLPMHEKVENDQAEESVTPLVGGTESILIVEDEEIVRSLTQHLLEGWGYQVFVAEDGKSACALFEARQGQIDLLLTDVIMPAMSGQVLATHLREQQPDLKVVYMSGYTHDFIGQHGILEDEVTLLRKPFTREDLSGKIRAVLDN
ncbi:MAG: PAS domain S-box protein [Candidatus Latescibacteria bacterium]|nr:PAS domain S-box protein [Candidatus Latescibacterota bacterium]